MHPFPHNYSVRALAAPGGVVTVRSKDLEDIQSTAPPEFNGPPGNWSPETLLVASVVDCFVLQFRAIAAASKLEWLEIDCAANGVLEKTEQGLCFTRIDLEVGLRVPQGANIEWFADFRIQSFRRQHREDLADVGGVLIAASAGSPSVSLEERRIRSGEHAEGVSLVEHVPFGAAKKQRPHSLAPETCLDHELMEPSRRNHRSTNADRAMGRQRVAQDFVAPLEQ